jgi:hypothetical protein
MERKKYAEGLPQQVTMAHRKGIPRIRETLDEIFE